MIPLGLRLTLHGGREAVRRLLLVVAAVGLGAGLPLAAVSGINAANTQNDADGASSPRPSPSSPPRSRCCASSPARRSRETNEGNAAAPA